MRLTLLLGLLAILQGCGWSFPSLPSNSPDRQFHQVEHETITPAYVEIDGKQHAITYKVERDYSIGLNQHQPKVPAWKRALNALFGWSFLGGIILLILTGLGIPAIPMLLLAIRRIRASNKHLSQIVKGVDKGLASLSDTQKEQFKSELSKTFDGDTKKAVVKMKEGI